MYRLLEKMVAECLLPAAHGQGLQRMSQCTFNVRCVVEWAALRLLERVRVKRSGCFALSVSVLGSVVLHKSIKTPPTFWFPV